MKKIVDVSNKSGFLEIILAKEGQELEIVGRFQTHGVEVRELNIRIVHRAPRTTANTTLKGVVWDDSQLKLSGTIVIEKNAQQTKSFLRENVLLLSPNAKAEAIPNLEIEANDVKCSHAATISNISDEEVFYLMSRGISRKEAEELIVEGFLT
jgi:Fe-S cluster assembly protein SufD